MSSRGRPATLPPHDHTRPRPLSSDSLVVHHYNSHGRVRDFDFSTLPVAEPLQRSLAELFAARCVPEDWAAHRTAIGYWLELVRFSRFIAEQPEAVRDLDELTAGVLRRWRNSLPLGDKRPFTRVARLLREDPRLRSGPTADELLRRVIRPKSTTQSYSHQEFARIRVAARRTFRGALRRIEFNASHLERWREGAFPEDSPDWLVGEALDVLARTGSMPESTVRNASTTDGVAHVVAEKYRRPLGGKNAEVTWQRLFLSRRETTALAILLMTEFGWNLSVVAGLKVPAASPDPGLDGHPTYRITLEKPRRGPGRHHETRNVTDDGGASVGRVSHPRLAGHAIRSRCC